MTPPDIKALTVSLLNTVTAWYLRRNRVVVVAVAGSIGKTSTVRAVRTVLGQRYRVHVPRTAYNTTKSIHLEIFGIEYATSAAGWLWAVVRVLVRSCRRASFDVLVIELGTDHPGEMAQFAFLHADIGILTAITAEHMEHFGTIEQVAAEELVLASYCDELLLNRDTVPAGLVPTDIAARALWYGGRDTYRLERYRRNGHGATVSLMLGLHRLTGVPVQVAGAHSTQALVAAGAVGFIAGLGDEQVAAGLSAITAVPGRMQLLEGVSGSLIIDDSYNASPDAVKAALDHLYSLRAPQRIAVLGSMNEMGDYSAKAHKEVGSYCEAAKLDLVVTIGRDARRHLAPAARRQGCAVHCFDDPYSAGAFVLRQLRPKAAVLFKGSQNGVFAEEAIKSVLAKPSDAGRLVRQSAFWMRRKRQQFGRK